MSSGISFSGLSSGIDSAQIIEQLIAIDRRPVTIIENQNAEEEFKLEILQQINTDLLAVKTSAEALADGSAFEVFSASSSDTDLVSASVTGSAAPGSVTVEVLSLAQAQSRSSQSFSSNTEALGLSGEIVINGKAITISASDDLVDIQGAINGADAGVQAQLLNVSETDNRLLISSDTAGSAGFSLRDASSSDVLQGLGFTSTATSIANPVTGGGAKSDQLTSATTTVGTLLGLASPPSGTVTIGNQNVAIDLQAMSLTDIKAAIDAAAPAGVTTSIVTEEDENGSNVFRLQVDGTTTFLDSNNVLEAIGILGGAPDVSAAVAEVQTGSIANTTNGSDPIDSSSKFSDLFGSSVANDDTITISGTDRDGNAVSGSFTVSNVNADRISDLLTEVESVFGSNVTAAVDANGQIEVTDHTSGASQLSISLNANNEGGGTLNFGTFSASTEGQNAQSKEVVAGQDATFRVNGVTLTRTSNTVTDAIDGLTLNLNDAQAGSIVSINIARDTSSIRSSIESLVENYNTSASFISEQFVFNEEFQASGPLSGDTTVLTLQSQLRQTVFNPVAGLGGEANSLTLFGVAFNREGQLEIDGGRLDEVLAGELTSLRNVLSASATATDSDIDFVFQTDSTVAGTYDIEITAAAEQADVTGSVDISSGLANATTITVTDLLSGKSDSIDLLVGDDTDSVVDKLNTVMASNVAEVKTGSIVNTTDGATPVDASTTFDSVFGAGVVAGDTIDIQGTTHSNETVTSSFTIADPTTDTIGDLMSKIQTVFGGAVSTSLDANGQIVVADNQIGNSSLNVVLIERNEGGGSLDFGQFEQTGEGRFAMAITASNDGGALRLTSEAFGNTAGFTISQTANETGITDGDFRGVDVAGTLNGEAATGTGRVLTGNVGNGTSDGLAIRATITPAQLIAQGQNQGSITIIQGVGDQLRRTLENITDPFSGLVATRQQAIKDTIEANDAHIIALEGRLELKRSTLQRQFTAMEIAVARLNSLGSFLGAQLAGLARTNA